MYVCIYGSACFGASAHVYLYAHSCIHMSIRVHIHAWKTCKYVHAFKCKHFAAQTRDTLHIRTHVTFSLKLRSPSPLLFPAKLSRASLYDRVLLIIDEVPLAEGFPCAQLEAFLSPGLLCT